MLGCTSIGQRVVSYHDRMTVAPLRSLLFAPANRPELTAKLPRSGPDGAVLDLEDAVPDEAKAGARAVAAGSARDLAATAPEVAWFVRVNPVATEWFADDLTEALVPGLTGVVVPKLETAAEVGTVVAALADGGHGGLGVLAGLETAAGVERAGEVLGAPGVVAAYFGAEDYVADLGGIRTPEGEFSVRLGRIFAGLSELVAAQRPAEVAVEQVFMAKNAASALKLGHARGAAIAAVVTAELPVFEYTPRSVKQALVGTGGAEKEQVQHMVRLILGIQSPLALDASDALAVALCHAHTRGNAQRLGQAPGRQPGRSGRWRAK